MEAIEPHWVALLWFAAFATVSMVALLVMAGMFPLRSRPQAGRSGVATLLVIGNGILLLALLAATGFYGVAELRWSSLVVVTGLVMLFAPGLFELWPQALCDGWKGLVVLVGIQMLALAALAKISGASWANLS
jgi:hypothetical protein